jgi:hypothetical protein
MAPALSEEYPQALPVIAERITGLQHMALQDEDISSWKHYHPMTATRILHTGVLIQQACEQGSIPISRTVRARRAGDGHGQ